MSEERDLSGVENGVLLCKESFRYSVVEVERSTKARKRRKKRGERQHVVSVRERRIKWPYCKVSFRYCFGDRDSDINLFLKL